MTPDTTDPRTDSTSNRSRTITLALVAIALVGALAVGIGGVAAAPATQPAAGAAGSNGTAASPQTSSDAPLIVSDSIVIAGGSTAPGQATCQVTNRFYHGQKMVFRIKVIDPQSGQQLSNDSLQQVDVNIPQADGSTKSLEAEWGQHPGGDHFWSIAWTVPDGYPSGPVDYSISVTNHQAERVNFAVPPSQLTVLNESLSDVKASSSGGSSGPAQSGGSTSLPLVFWLVVLVVAVVVVGLVWNAERR